VHGEQRANGLRTLVVGASSGIGGALAAELAARGARVVGAARRLDRLVALPGVTGLRCDVREADACEQLLAAATEHLGGLDALVYAAGISKITPLNRSGIDEWLEVFETNLFGAVLVTRAAMPHLTAPDSEGRALFLSSDSSELAFPGLVAYSASKAALGRFCQGLGDEVQSLRVTEVVVGPTAGTEVSNNFDPAEFTEWATRWFEEGYVRHGMQHPSEVVAVIVDALLAEAPPPRVIAAGRVDDAAHTLDEGRLQAEDG
jgi:NAD(P)-dependent dehydrogenase (short-subunit alcohol dehydrogenase family)